MREYFGESTRKGRKRQSVLSHCSSAKIAEELPSSRVINVGVRRYFIKLSTRRKIKCLQVATPDDGYG